MRFLGIYCIPPYYVTHYIARDRISWCKGFRNIETILWLGTHTRVGNYVRTHTTICVMYIGTESDTIRFVYASSHIKIYVRHSIALKTDPYEYIRRGIYVRRWYLVTLGMLTTLPCYIFVYLSRYFPVLCRKVSTFEINCI